MLPFGFGMTELLASTHESHEESGESQASLHARLQEELHTWVHSRFRSIEIDFLRWRLDMTASLPLQLARSMPDLAELQRQDGSLRYDPRAGDQLNE